MATLNDIMTREVATIEPDDTLRNAAQRMSELNIGALPVTDEDALLGMIPTATPRSARSPRGWTGVTRRSRT